jgi:hypothetical protein
MSKSAESSDSAVMTVKQQWFAALSSTNADHDPSTASNDDSSPDEAPGRDASHANLPELTELRTTGKVLEVPVRETLPMTRPAVSFVQAIFRLALPGSTPFWLAWVRMASWKC